MLHLVRQWWSSSKLFRFGLIVLIASTALDGAYHTLLLFPLSETAERLLFPFSGPMHILILIGFNMILVGITLARRARLHLAGTRRL